MRDTILVPLDGSELAEAALPHAVALAHATTGDITLLHCLPRVGDEEHLGPCEAVMRGQISTGYLADRMRATGLIVHTAFVEGNPASQILAYAEASPEVNMIVLHRDVRSGMRGRLFGGILERVVHAAPVPVFVTSSSTNQAVNAAEDYSTIIVPLDGSPFAEHALRDARRLAIATGAAIYLLAVVPGEKDDMVDLQAPLPPYSVVPLWRRAEHDGYIHQLQAYLRQQKQELERAGLQARAELTYGAPATETVKMLAAREQSMIVMATHGRSGFRRFCLGSVAHEVMQHTDLPILLVRPDHEQGSYARPREESFVAGL